MPDPERDARVARMLRGGATYVQIRHTLGVSSDTVTRVRKTHGIHVPDSRGGRPVDAARRQAVADMLTAGAKYSEIITALRVSTRTINKVREETGLPRRKQRPPAPRLSRLAPERRALLTRLIGEGLSDYAIRLQTGAAQATVQRLRAALDTTEARP